MDKTAKTRVTYYGESELITVEHNHRVVLSDSTVRQYKKWLKEESHG